MSKTKTCLDKLRSYAVVQQKWTQVPDPETILDPGDNDLPYLKDLYSKARTLFDNYLSYLIYKVILKDNEKRRTYNIQPKYARLEEEVRHHEISNDLPFVKDILPNQIAKEFRKDKIELPTVSECVRARKEHADHFKVMRFGKIT